MTDSLDDDIEPADCDPDEDIPEAAEVGDSIALVVDGTLVTPTVAIVADASDVADTVELVIDTFDVVVVAEFGGVVIFRTDEGAVVLDKLVDVELAVDCEDELFGAVASEADATDTNAV